jgi:hypothetical protein
MLYVLYSTYNRCTGPRVGELSGPSTLQQHVCGKDVWKDGEGPSRGSADSCFSVSRDSESLTATWGRAAFSHSRRTAAGSSCQHSEQAKFQRKCTNTPPIHQSISRPVFTVFLSGE